MPLGHITALERNFDLDLTPDPAKKEILDGLELNTETKEK